MVFIVITTIQPPTASIMAILAKAQCNGLETLVIGDRKTPNTKWPVGAEFFSLAHQKKLGFTLANLLPEHHYARKNIGYLLAMSRNAEVIFDTDDDNAPLASWRRRAVKVEAQPYEGTGWVNVYKWYSDRQIWPRGFPLEMICKIEEHPKLGAPVACNAPIQQGLANGSPDVDAVWRLTLDEEITFHDRGSVYLPSGVWCPFNSQSTWWFPEAYPLMYLPSFVSFRMTDIWRSFVAQRCLWAMGYGLVFHGPEMFQERNPHNLLRDFEQEIPGYLSNDRIRAVLEGLFLPTGAAEVGNNCRRCYQALVDSGLIPVEEMPLVDHWLGDVKRVSEGRELRRDD